MKTVMRLNGFCFNDFDVYICIYAPADITFIVRQKLETVASFRLYKYKSYK